jgi:hypothetical protein
MNKKIVSITDSYPIHPRLEKISNYFSQAHQEFFISWNREGHGVTPDYKNFIFNSRIGYGNRVKKLFLIFRFRGFVKEAIHAIQPEIIICRHWQMFFLVLSLRTNKKIVYDVCDIPNSKVIRLIENWLIRYARLVILASHFYEFLYNIDNKIILENRPLKSLNLTNYKKSSYKIQKKDNSKLVITFLGKIRYYSILINLINAVKGNKELMLNFCGDGSDRARIKDYCEEHKIHNVNFYGKFCTRDIPFIYNNSDLIWCAYPSELKNVQLAISNKYFETLAYKKPGIFSCNTKLSHKIKERNIGFVVDAYDTNEIKKLLIKVKIQKSILREVVVNIELFNEPIYWEDYLKDQIGPAI